MSPLFPYAVAFSILLLMTGLVLNIGVIVAASDRNLAEKPIKQQRMASARKIARYLTLAGPILFGALLILLFTISRN